MNKLNKLFTYVLLVATLFAASCSKDLQDDVNDLKDRVTLLEETTAKLQQAIDAGKLITAVTPLPATPTTPAGWEITFSDNSKIPVYNGEKGDTGDKGETGPQGLTPYMWINSAGNWATNPGSKPADSDNVAYEIKANGQSVKAYGTSVRVKNIDGFVGFEEYDAVSGVVKNTIKTTIPYDHQNYITAIVETDESVTMSINGKDYTMLKTAVFPTSITVLRDKGYVEKGGYCSFYIAVNPSTHKVYPQEDFSLDYEPDYFTRAYGWQPDFLSIVQVKPIWDDEDTQYEGQYYVTLQWEQTEGDINPFKDMPIFIVLNYKDQKGNISQIISSTPILMTEEYRSIEDGNVLSINDIHMFTDETYTDSVRLSKYHEGYVNTINFPLAPNAVDAPHLAVNDPLQRYIVSQGDKYKFAVNPIPGSNATIWPAGKYLRIVDAKAQVTDYGRAAIPAVKPDPYTGHPGSPAYDAIPAKTIERPFKIYVYKVPADGVIYKHDFSDYWIPNKTVNYTPTVTLGAELAKNGYVLADWDFAVKSQILKKAGAVVPMTDNITEDTSKFDAANNFTTSYKLLPTINAGVYTVEMVVTATPKSPRPTGLSQQAREFKIVMTITVVNPVFTILIQNSGTHQIFAANSDTYHTYKIADVNITTLLDVESTKNISKKENLVSQREPLGYEFDLTDPRHGAQGVRFNPYPAVIAPIFSDWGSLAFIKKPITVIVKLDTHQEIPVLVKCAGSNDAHGNSKVYVQYDRLNLDHVDAVNAAFKGNYNTMISTGINISAGSNFTPQSAAHITLDPTMIKNPGGIVFSAIGTVQCQGGLLPNGLSGKRILSIDAATGLVKSIDGMTWENPDAVLYQTFRVTYTDIWNNSAYKEVNVYVKSNSVPN